MLLGKSVGIHMQMSRTKDPEFALKIKYEMKYLFGFIIAMGVGIVLIHVIIFITDDYRYIGTSSAVLLGSSACISLFILLSNPRKSEFHSFSILSLLRKIQIEKFKYLFLGITLWALGEFTYTYYQLVLNTDAPYPGVGEIFYLVGYYPLILFTYRSFKTMNRDGIIKRKVIVFVVTLAFALPVISTILVFSQEVDFQSQWPDIVIDTITTYSDAFLLSLSILILTKLPRNNPYIYHWILFASFMILTIITDFFYLYIAIVNEELLSKTEVIWEAMWAFAYLCILASLIWYYKLIHILSENTRNLTEYYGAKYQNNISVEDKGELPEGDQLHTEKTHNFKLVESRIDETINGTKGDITIFFSNINTLKRKETQSILKFLQKKPISNILARILFPLGVDDRIIDSYSEVAHVRIFERKIENNKIIIVTDYSKLLVVSTTDPIDYDKETTYSVTYSENKEITYTYVTIFEKLWLLQTVTKLEVR
jgi:hypothetical protein